MLIINVLCLIAGEAVNERLISKKLYELEPLMIKELEYTRIFINVI